MAALNNNINQFQNHFNFQLPLAQQTMPVPTYNINLNDFSLLKPSAKERYYKAVAEFNNDPLFKKYKTSISEDNTDFVDDNPEIGRAMGTLFSSGLSSAGNTIVNNIIKGQYFADNLGKNTTSSIAGAGVGLAANYIGQGINSLGGNSMLSRGIGQGVATGLGTVGGAAVNNLFNSGSIGKIFGKAGSINPYGLAMSVVGSGLGAAFGPSKEYSGTYGGITKTMDTVYDGVMAGVNFVPGGQVFSGAMALNKGLSNIFGSTDGMTKNDAVLGSAFMPAPIKWLNMAGAHTTGKFENQTYKNIDKTNRFMQNGFGNLGEKFDQARRESQKTYGGGIFGLFSSTDEYKKAQSNINFANDAFTTLLAMVDQNELQNIRSQDMTSINNQRYAQDIMGGWNQTSFGKQGMKILNNATNHNIGMRLLSGAALIDSKQMILCNAHD